MRASVLHEQGTPLGIEDLDLEPPRTGEVLVRMVASGVCHSCLHAADGSWKGVPVPIVLGDEGAGVVEEVGPGVESLAPGDPVILSWAPTCGRCHYCVIGRPNLCERRQPGRGVLPDGTTRMSLRGQPVYHYGHVATYASATVVHESCAIRIDKNMPLDRAALIGCSVMTGVGAVINTAAVPPGASIAVFGVGGVGLNVVQGGALVAAHPVIAIDIKAAKLEHARAGRQPRGGCLARGRGGGHPSHHAPGRRLRLRRGGRHPGREPGRRGTGAGRHLRAHRRARDRRHRAHGRATTDVRPLVTGERVIRGSSYGSARTREDLPRLVSLYLAGKLKVDQLITRRYGLDEANEAFRALAAGELARGLIVF